MQTKRVSNIVFNTLFWTNIIIETFSKMVGTLSGNKFYSEPILMKHVQNFVSD